MTDPTPSSTPAPRPLPTGTEIVVIGGGIIGISAAWTLHALGVPVVLCEKGRIAGEQSSRNWGWIRKQGRDPAELELMRLAFRLWPDIVRTLPEDIGWHVGGVTYLIETEQDAAEYAAWLEHARAWDLDSRLLSVAETDALLPGNRIRHQGALHTASDARAEPALAVPAMARALRAKGVPLLETCAVRTIERSGGRVTGVVTEHGRIACNAVILAGGAWSRTLLEHLGVRLPQLAVISSVQRTGPAPLVTQTALDSKGMTLRRRADGGYSLARGNFSRVEIGPANLRYARHYRRVLRRDWRTLKFRFGRPFFQALFAGRWDGDTVSPFERTRVLDPTPDHRLLDDVLAATVAAFPELAGLRAVERWAGAIDVLPDEIPAIGPVPGLDGLFLSTGYTGHGFGIGPAAGHVTARLAAGLEPGADLTAFRPDRFG